MVHLPNQIRRREPFPTHFKVWKKEVVLTEKNFGHLDFNQAIPVWKGFPLVRFKDLLEDIQSPIIGRQPSRRSLLQTPAPSAAPDARSTPFTIAEEEEETDTNKSPPRRGWTSDPGDYSVRRSLKRPTLTPLHFLALWSMLLFLISIHRHPFPWRKSQKCKNLFWIARRCTTLSTSVQNHWLTDEAHTRIFFLKTMSPQTL